MDPFLSAKNGRCFAGTSPGAKAGIDAKNHNGETPLEFSNNLRAFCRCVSAGLGAGLGRRGGRHRHQELQGRNACRIFNQSKSVLPLRFRRPGRRPGRRPPAQAGGRAGTDTKNDKGETLVDFSNNLQAVSPLGPAGPPACRPFKRVCFS
jgi:hypothetical protein